MIKRFAFYVSGQATRLQKIVELYPQIMENTFIVINDEGSNPIVEKIVLERNIPYIEFSYSDKCLKGKDRNDYLSKILLEKLLELNIDFTFCFGSKLLQGDLLKTYKNRIINFHPAILPMFPGIKAIDNAMKSNSFLLGNTAHFIDDGKDTGPIIMQSIIQSSTFTNYEDVLRLQLPMINQIFNWINEDRIKVHNNIVEIEKANYNQIIYIPNIENN